MGLLKFLKTKKRKEEKKVIGRNEFERDIEGRMGQWGHGWAHGPVSRRANSLPDMPLTWRASMAYELQDSKIMGGGENNCWSYSGGIKNAIARCCAVFGVKPNACSFKKIGARWYRVEIEDVVLLTKDYHEHFGSFYRLLSPCPYCEQQVKGSKSIASLYDLGEAMALHEPCEEHFRDCYPWRKACAKKMGDFYLVCAVEYADWEEVCAAGK